MKLESFTASLRGALSEGSKILTDKNDQEFKTSLERWSDLDLQVPAAIVKPISEADTVVKEAVKASVPFVPATGGHSQWSTVGDDGFILDFSLYKDVTVDSTTHVAKVKGGVLTKELQVALNKAGRFTTVSNGNTVGVIPYFLNGGISSYTPLIGFACENILSARIITAKGDIVEVDENSNSDLLWAIRGAGQYFGIVTELGIKTYSLSTIGNADGSRSLGTFIFPTQRAEDVCRAMSTIMADPEHTTAGHFMIVNPPPAFQQCLMVAPQYLGPTENAATAFKPLADLEPMMAMSNPVTFENHSDHISMMCAKGDFKRFSQIGIQEFKTENFIKLIDIHRRLLERFPDAGRSGLTVEWHSPSKRSDTVDTAFGNHGIDLWLNVLSWYTDPAHHEGVAQLDREAQAAVRAGTEEKDFVTYVNSDRLDPIDYRYKGSERQAKLRKLKQAWDPNGIFTKEFLHA